LGTPPGERKRDGTLRRNVAKHDMGTGFPLTEIETTQRLNLKVSLIERDKNNTTGEAPGREGDKTGDSHHDGVGGGVKNPNKRVEPKRPDGRSRVSEASQLA